MRSDLIPRPVPRILPATTGLGGVVAAFHNFFGQACSAADTLIEANHPSNLKKIEQENVEQCRRATAEALMVVREDIEKVIFGATKALNCEIFRLWSGALRLRFR